MKILPNKAFLLISLSLTVVCSGFAGTANNPASTPELPPLQAETTGNPMTDEIRWLKKFDKAIRKRMREMRSGAARSAMVAADEMSIIDAEKSWWKKIQRGFFFYVFPGPLLGGNYILLTKEKAPVLYKSLVKICERFEIEIPPVYLSCDTRLFNVCGSTINPDMGVIILGERLMELLNEQELEGIIAHELAHIEQKHLVKKGGLNFLVYFLTAIVAAATDTPDAGDVISAEISSHYEMTADTVGARKLGSVDGLIGAMNVFLEQREMYKKDHVLLEKQIEEHLDGKHRIVAAWMRGWSGIAHFFTRINHWFAKHSSKRTQPTEEDRIGNLVVLRTTMDAN